ncbi:ABC transporter permease [Listeria ivanovii]|uniref:ABC transporter permease n=1 Tax=Listeria ivanovii TaxID=1638 RepID=UPI000DA97012|nr:ABC transporter permease [Listeria ivanovii]PZG33980.1 ABC transporter permease [Listeria ivanovii]PZG48524.1 ABC transporter permease [Listeria ivanovii]PZH11723.1 ABC transporter permease [Listeria ivanovii]
MKTMFHQVIKQLICQYKSKYILMMFVALMGICLFSTYTQANILTSREHRFNETEMMYEKDGISLEQALKEDLTVKKDGNSEEINNILKYDYFRYVAAKNALAPLNAPNQLFTSAALLILPIIIGIYFAFVAIMDYKSGTLRTQLLYNKFKIYFISKLISLFFVTIFSVVSLTILSIFIQKMYNIIFQVKLDHVVLFINQLPKQLLYEITSLYIIGLIVFLITFLLKSHVFSIILLLLYMLLIPNLGGVDLKNVMLLIMSKVFNTSASSMEMIEGQEVNLISSSLLIILIVLLFATSMYFLVKRREIPKQGNFQG